MTQQNIIWGFMLENAYFVEFDSPNHQIIETAYQQKKLKQASHYIIIHDSHLPSPARIYFGVIQIHLRMPGTRYYVKRKIISIPSSSNHHHPTTTTTTTNHHENHFNWLFPFSSSSSSSLSFTLSSIPTIHPISNNHDMNNINKSLDINQSSFIDMNHHLDNSCSWLDSIYTAMPLFTNVQALLIPWSTSPPPPSYSN